MSGSHIAIMRRVEHLYEGVVMSPGSWTDRALAEWGVEAFAEGSRPSKALGREVRRCLRAAAKLRNFWLDPPPGVPSDSGDWRTRVDVALGITAWRPVLGIVQIGLSEAPTEEVFDAVKVRFREVHAAAWMEDLSYADWLDAGEPSAD